MELPRYQDLISRFANNNHPAPEVTRAERKAVIHDPKIMVKGLKKFLGETTANEVIIRTTRVSGGWSENEFAAHAAGFDIFLVHDKTLEGFDECYRLIRRKA